MVIQIFYLQLAQWLVCRTINFIHAGSIPGVSTFYKMCALGPD